MKKKVIIVIATYNGLKWLPKCLKSIPANYTIVIVDNNSKDATVQFIQENYPLITLIQQTKNVGFGAANNIGISYALKQGADYVFLLNQDAYLQNNTIEQLIAVHKNNTEYGIISPIHLNGSGDKLDVNFSNYLAVNKEIIFDSLQNKFTNKVYELPFVNAAAWLLPIKTIETIGGFDPIFHHYSEDDNYCQRALFHGFKIGIVPNTYIYHDREFRTREEAISNKTKLLLKERYLKYKWANINIEIGSEIKKSKNKLRKLIVKLLLKLQFKKVSYFFSELSLIKKIIPKIEKSRKLNKTIGLHYLKK